MTFIRSFVICLFCCARLINCQPTVLDLLTNQDFFRFNITVDYTTCGHSFYNDETGDGYQVENEDGYNNNDNEEDYNYYEDEQCKRY